jgi:predicted nucleic acid-binding protein
MASQRSEELLHCDTTAEKARQDRPALLHEAFGARGQSLRSNLAQRRLELRWAEQGMDFADALHLASAAGCVAFASFDRGLKQTAAKMGAPAVRAP